MYHRSRNHHAAHLDDSLQHDVPEMELVHRGEPSLISTDEQLARLIEILRADGLSFGGFNPNVSRRWGFFLLESLTG